MTVDARDVQRHNLVIGQNSGNVTLVAVHVHHGIGRNRCGLISGEHILTGGGVRAG